LKPRHRILIAGSCSLLSTLLVSLWPAGCAGGSLAYPESAAYVPWRARTLSLPAAWDSRGESVGAEVCSICHPEVTAEFAGASHAGLLEGPEGDSGCESCHGPGEAHEESLSPDDIEGFRDSDPGRVAATCASCHLDDLSEMEARGEHYGSDRFACTACHAAHPGTQLEPLVTPDYLPGGALDPRLCMDCHADSIEAHLRSDHASLIKGPFAAGCEACHGSAEEHLASGGGSGTMQELSAARKEELCQSCHAKSPSPSAFAHSSHGKAGLGCLDCHSILSTPGKTTVQPEPELCARCHAAESLEFSMPNHHPIPEGAMECSSCHEVHKDRRSVFRDRIVSSRCTECHWRYAGPFVYEHEADRMEGCLACHAPHGSPNRGLLKVYPTRDLCLQCHPDTPANPPHNLSDFSPFQNCLRCHTEVHGSDLDPTMFR